MRRKALTLGLILILAAVFVLEQGAQVFAPVAEVAGLGSFETQENTILPPTLYSVPAANYSFVSQDLTAGAQYVGAVQVAGGRQVGFYVMDEGNFSLWHEGRKPPALTLAEPIVTTSNFTVSPTSSGTYFFVFDNQDSSALDVVFSLSSVRTVLVLSPFVQYAGFELLLLGVILSAFGVRGGKRKKDEKREIETGWECKYCGARNAQEDRSFCVVCRKAQG
jgi:hypothetical protein